MAWLVPIWKIYGFHKVSLNLERFVLNHATADIHKPCVQYKTNYEKTSYFIILYNLL